MPHARVRAAARDHPSHLIKPGTVVALPTAPSIAPLIDTPPAALDAHRLQVMRLTCIGRPRRTAPGEPPRRHGFGMPRRPLVDRLGGWRRSHTGHGFSAFTALRHCRSIVTLSPRLFLGFGLSRNGGRGPQVLEAALVERDAQLRDLEEANVPLTERNTELTRAVGNRENAYNRAQNCNASSSTAPWRKARWRRAARISPACCAKSRRCSIGLSRRRSRLRRRRASRTRPYLLRPNQTPP